MVRDIARSLSLHYYKELDRVGANLYRNGRNSVEWRQLPADQIEGRRVVPCAAVGYHRNSACSMDMLTPWVVFLTGLLPEAAIPFT